MLLRFALAGVLIFTLTAASVSSAVLLEIDDDLTTFVRSSPRLDRQTTDLLADVAPGKAQTILVIGDDRRKADVLDSKGRPRKRPPPTRSDTMILIRLDPSKGATAIMSLPRDLMVDIPGHGRDQLNAAFAIGEDQLALRTIRSLLQIPIHHYVRVTFWGFRGIVDRVGCIYTDIDRKYFNDNKPPAGGGGAYAVIDVKSGYQRLCGQDALDYVRFRHLDNDLVRESRQQQFLSDARAQVAIGSLFSDRKQLLSIFGQSVRTDIDDTKAILSLLKLVAGSAGKPLQPVHLNVTDDPTDPNRVVSTPDAITDARDRFLAVRATASPQAAAKKAKPRRASARTRRRAASKNIPPGLFLNKRPGEDQATRLAVKLRARLPVYYPRLMTTRGEYPGGSRSYTIRDRSGAPHKAYRIVVYQGTNGQYYGVQGTTWRNPPILDDPSETVRMAGRKYELFYNGRQLRLVAWRTPKGAYWVSNTLLRTLNNRQMLALARSLTRAGA